MGMMAQLVWGGNSGVEIQILKNTACQAPSPKEHKILDALTDQSFIWTHRDGRQAAKRQLLDKLGSVKRPPAPVEDRREKKWRTAQFKMES
jgi:hypothetical protein